mmetsp:Transcript_6440/g.26210  ORF Transcript_6440/g.26210 Transcript_6440/m.26210 type:complete len:322 (-) Transcript_6440:35-1000(-)
MELAHDVAAHLRDFEHLPELLGVAGDEVQEGKALEVLGLLVRKLDDLVVTLPQRLDAELVPGVLIVELLRGGQRHLDVSALDREVEPGPLILDKVQRNLGETLVLEVRDDALAAQRARLDHGEHLVVLALDERELEHVLGGVDLNLSVATVPVEAVHDAAENLGEVHRGIQRADDARVSVWQGVLDVVQRRVDKDAAVVPRAGLDPDGLVNSHRLTELAVGDDDRVLGQHRHQGHVRGPDDVLDGWRRELCHRGPLLDVVQYHLVLASAQEGAGAGVEDPVARGVRRRAPLGHLVLEVLDVNLVRPLVERRESVPGDEDGG